MELARHKGIIDIILLGDIFDTPHPPQQLQLALLKFFNKNSDLFFHIVIGNHDWESARHNALMLTKNLTRLFPTNYKVYDTPEIVRIDGIRLFMCSHPNVLDRPNTKVDWCIGHFAWNGAAADNGFAIKTPNAPKGRWILGDFHTHQHTSRYVYAGSLHQVNWLESNSKGVLIFDEDDWVWHTITSSYSLNTMHVAGDADLKKIHLTSNDYWSIKTLGGYTLPTSIKSEYPNIVHITASNRKKSRAQKVLLDTRDTALYDPLKKLPDFLAGSKASLTEREIKWALNYTRKIENQILR
jgi:hypothetical protein